MEAPGRPLEPKRRRQQSTWLGISEIPLAVLSPEFPTEQKLGVKFPHRVLSTTHFHLSVYFHHRSSSVSFFIYDS